MKVIQESPEHHFLTFLDKAKADPGGWIGFHFALSKKLQHNDIISQPDHIKGKLHKLNSESETLTKELSEKAENDSAAMLYRFSDSDIILFMRPGNNEQLAVAQALFKGMEKKIGTKLCEQRVLAKDLYNYQKLADERFLAASKITAYEAMADSNKVQSIKLRRQRHEDAVIMIVEDDRFTASYAANILNKDYDVVLAKTGEEAISLYIEHAPDMVFLDIHLPGLNGLNTLSALRKVDPEAFIFILSVDTVKQNIIGANQEGAAGFLKKPFGKERLLAATEKSPFVKKLKNK